MDKIDIFNEERKELIERINAAEKYKKEVVDKVQKLAAKFSIGELSFFEYYSRLKQEFGDKTPEEWVRYYEKYIEKCKEQLKKCGEEIRKIRTEGIVKRVVPLVVFLIFTFSIYYYLSFFGEKPVLFSPIESYSDDVDFSLNESGNFAWKVGDAGQLNSLKISGEIVGKGNVKVYLQGGGKEFLILDSNDLKGVGELRGNAISGNIVRVANRSQGENVSIESLDNLNNSGQSNNVGLGNNSNADNSTTQTGEDDKINNTGGTKLVRVFSEYCKETCDLFSYNLSEISYTLRVEIIGEAEIKIDKIVYELVQKENATGIGQALNDTSNIIKTEKRIDRGKEVKVSKKIGLKNVEVKTQIPLTWKIKEPENIIVYWKEGNRNIDFSGNDINGDGYIDEIIWLVGDLESEQTFEIIIITKAEHLDMNKSFISNIYEEVKELDEIWSEEIRDGEFVRVSFEKNLTYENDITLWIRTASGSPKIEVYEKDGDEIIALFDNLKDNEYNKVLLTLLIGTQDNFDLRVIGGSLEFDHIIDPFAFPGGTSGNVELKPQGCSRQDLQLSQNTFDLPCDGTYPSNICQAEGDRISCDDENFETATFRRGRYGGINASYFNSTIENCFSIINVSLCYKSWGIVDQQACNLGVDADGGASWTDISVGCDDSEPSSIMCINVNSLENWQCDNFFGASGTRALAKSQATRTGGNPKPIITWTFDTLFFNVTYKSIMNKSYIVLNAPGNATYQIRGNITLNASVFDIDNDKIDSKIYGIIVGNENNFYKHGLLYQAFGANNGSSIIYNYTSPVIVPDNNTVVLYHLDNYSKYGENQTFVYDYAYGKLNLTPVGNAFPNMTGGKFAGAWQFDGNGDYLSDAGNLGALNNQQKGTFSAWIKRAGNNANGYETIIQEGGDITGYVLTANCNDNLISFGVRGGGSAKLANTSNNVLMDGNWHLLTGAYDSSVNKIELYIDGTSVNSTTALTTTDPSRGIRVGGHGALSPEGNTCDGSSNSASFNGTIDEVAIWNRSLSETEILELYRLKAGKYYWKVNVTDETALNNESETREFYITTQIMITEVNATEITQNTAIINWTTNILANSSINYGLTASLGNIVPDTNLVIKHNISLTGLLADRLYYYNVTSCSSENVCVTNGTFNFTTLTLSNQAPVIELVEFTDVGAVLGGVQNVLINFSAKDLNGAGDLNDSSARVEIYNSSKEVASGTRTNSTCSVTGSSGNTKNYTCTIGMWYFDSFGNYIVNATISDNGGLKAENSSRLFNFLETSGFTLYPGAISWGVLNPGDINKYSIENLTINNTGNVNFTSFNITAYNLSGVSDSSYYIPARNFWGSVNFGECSSPASQLDGNASVSISSFSSLAPGNLSIGGGVAQEELYFCLAQVPSPLLNQGYSTEVGIPWQIDLFAASFVLGGSKLVGNRKKKKKIVLEREVLLELFGDKLEELLEIVKENKLKKELKESKGENITIPLGIFRENIGAAETLCKYLKENKSLRFAEIARMLNRDRRTIGLNYKNSAKMKKKIVIEEGEIYVPLEIFADRRQSILESAVHYLRVEGYKNVEISKILGKDQRNVWTLYSRAVKKLKEGNKNI